MKGRVLFAKYKFAINILVGMYSIFPLKYRKRKFDTLRYKKGILGIGMRYVLLKSIAKNIGENVLINEGCFILHPEQISLGNNVSIQPMCYIDAIGGLNIGNDVSIAHNVTIMTSSHNYSDLNCPIKDQGVTSKLVTIQDNVWIGAKATILYGNRIESGAIVAAGAVVTKDVDANSIVGGVPAKKIRGRF